MAEKNKPSIELSRDIPRRMKRLFGVSWMPSIPFDRTRWPEEVRKLAGKMSLSGVQQKASVRLNVKTKQIELAQGDGTHILKPDPPEYIELSRVESLCMDMAEDLGMEVPPHAVLSLTDGTPAYIVKRFDRNTDGSKIHKEDMAQLLGFPTDAKYGGSLEKVGKAIRDHATNVFLDLGLFFERVVFNYMIGNGDMHLKNWALLMMPGEKEGKQKISLAPCYDFVSSKLYIPNEDDSALTLNGKRNKLGKSDFEAMAAHLGIDPVALRNSFQSLTEAKSRLLEMVASSNILDEKKQALTQIISSRVDALANRSE